MKKRIISLVLVLSVLLVVAVIPASAETNIEDFLTFNAQTGTITDCDKSLSGDVIIPDKIDGVKVEKIGGSAFSMSNISSITLPDSIWSIGYQSFHQCPNLTSVKLPDNLLSIGDGAFGLCENLKSVRVPGTITSLGTSIFVGCKNLENVILEDGLEYISDSMFASCEKLRNITIPDSVTALGDKAFERCIGLEKVTLSDNITSIRSGAFQNCFKLSEINFPSQLNSIGDNTFNFCRELTNADMSNSLVETIGDKSFYQCSALSDVKLSASLTSLGGNAFNSCSSLNSIELPQNLTAVEGGTFENCSSLTDVVLHDGLESLGYGAFQGCTLLENVNFPNTLRDIGAWAFNKCRKLNNIILPDNITNIDWDAFSDTGYYNDESNWEDESLYINHYLIRCEKNVTDYQVKEGTTLIGGSAFKYSPISIMLPYSVKYISDLSFDHCRKLSDVYYKGSKQQWNDIKIGSVNSDLVNANIHFNTIGFQVPNITKLTAESKNNGEYTVNLQLENVEYESCLICVVYDEHNRITGWKTTVISPNNIPNSISITADNAVKAKAFIWNRLEGMRPLCNAVEAKITTE